MIQDKTIAGTKQDQDIHQKAIAALAHYYKHRDYTALTKIIQQMPNSNRRVALLKWIQEFSVLRWDSSKNSLFYQKSPETQDIVAAESTPFWEFKIKQEQRRHISGNRFDSDSFFQNVIDDINKNIDEISIEKIEATISSLQGIIKIKNKRLSQVTGKSGQLPR